MGMILDTQSRIEHAIENLELSTQDLEILGVAYPAELSAHRVRISNLLIRMADLFTSKGAKNV